jgi:hypothetical protein
MQEYIRKLSISGEWRDIVDYDKKTILLTTLQSGVEIYLPS